MATSPLADLERLRRLRAVAAELDVERSGFIPKWQQIAQNFCPTRGKFLRAKAETESKSSRGVRRGQDILNSAPEDALSVGRAGLTAGMTPSQRPWFEFTLDDADLAERYRVRGWLFDTQQRFERLLHRSNFYNAAPIIYGDTMAFGCSAAMVLEDSESLMRLYPQPAGTYWVQADYRGVVDTFYRTLQLTVRGAVAMFGRDNVSARVRNDYDQSNYGKPVPVGHLVLPNDARLAGRQDSQNKRYLSAWWDLGANDTEPFLKLSGYDEFPVLVPRWETIGTETYGLGLCEPAIGDAKTLQLMESDKMWCIKMGARPPVVVPSTMKNPDLNPGGRVELDVLSGNFNVRAAYDVQLRLDWLLLAIEQTEKRVRAALKSDLFTKLTSTAGPQRTAREVDELVSENILQLGPVVENLNSDLLDRLFDRGFSIAFRAGYFAPPPPELAGHEIRVRYVSYVAAAQRSVGIQAIERTVAFAISLAGAKPTAIDALDTDDALRRYSEMTGAPPTIVLSGDQIAEIRRMRQQQEAAQQAALLSKPAAQAVHSLSDAQLGHGSALDALAQAGASTLSQQAQMPAGAPSALPVMPQGPPQ